MKSLQQIKDEHARKEGFKNWDNLIRVSIISSLHWDSVADLYAEECVREAVNLIDRLGDLHKEFFIHNTQDVESRIADLEQQLKQLKGE